MNPTQSLCDLQLIFQIEESMGAGVVVLIRDEGTIGDGGSGIFVYNLYHLRIWDRREIAVMVGLQRGHFYSLNGRSTGAQGRAPLVILA